MVPGLPIPTGTGWSAGSSHRKGEQLIKLASILRGDDDDAMGWTTRQIEDESAGVVSRSREADGYG